jgi:hypothetical protein
MERSLSKKTHLAVFLLGTLTIWLAAATAVQALGRRAECSLYARDAIEQYNEAQRMNCEFEGKLWSNARGVHFARCLLSLRRIQREYRTRGRMLRKCATRIHLPWDGKKSKRASCDIYARTVIMQIGTNRKYGCGYHGQEWRGGKRAHYNRCMRHSANSMMGELRFRARQLQWCFDMLTLR